MSLFNLFPQLRASVAEKTDIDSKIAADLDEVLRHYPELERAEDEHGKPCLVTSSDGEFICLRVDTNEAGDILYQAIWTTLYPKINIESRYSTDPSSALMDLSDILEDREKNPPHHDDLYVI